MTRPGISQTIGEHSTHLANEPVTEILFYLSSSLFLVFHVIFFVHFDTLDLFNFFN